MAALYLGAAADVDVIDRGVRVTSMAPEPVDVSVLSDDPNVLFRLAACLMVAADGLDTVNVSMARHPVGVGVPH